LCNPVIVSIWSLDVVKSPQILTDGPRSRAATLLSDWMSRWPVAASGHESRTIFSFGIICWWGCVWNVLHSERRKRLPSKIGRGINPNNDRRSWEQHRSRSSGISGRNRRSWWTATTEES
jgi:hypothetical protein